MIYGLESRFWVGMSFERNHLNFHLNYLLSIVENFWIDEEPKL